jgi:hypothetical protein
VKVSTNPSSGGTVVVVVVVVVAGVDVVDVGVTVVDVVDAGRVVDVVVVVPGMMWRIMPGCSDAEIVERFCLARSLPDSPYWLAMPIHESPDTTT